MDLPSGDTATWRFDPTVVRNGLIDGGVIVSRGTCRVSAAGLDSQTANIAAAMTAAANRLRDLFSTRAVTARASDPAGACSLNTNVTTDASAMRRERSFSRHWFLN